MVGVCFGGLFNICVVLVSSQVLGAMVGLAMQVVIYMYMASDLVVPEATGLHTDSMASHIHQGTICLNSGGDII